MTVKNSFSEYLTTRQSKDPKYDKKTMTNGPPHDQETFFGVCTIHLCQMNPPDEDPEPGHAEPPPKCSYFAWAGEICKDLMTLAALT